MANLLDLLCDLVERPDERDEYRQDPTAYVRSRGQNDLTGEDVSTALDAVRDLVPADLAASIASRAHDAPSVNPGADETPFVVALKSLSHLVDSVASHPEVTGRPDPKDTSVTAEVAAPSDVPDYPATDDSATDDSATDETAADASEPATDHRDDVFDPTALEVDNSGPEPSGPPPDPVDEPPYDPTAILGDTEPDTAPGLADVVPLERDNTSEPSEVDQAPAAAADENVLAFGGGESDAPAESIDDDVVPEVSSGGFGTGWANEPTETEAAPAGEAGDDAPPEPKAPMFKKKSGLTLPTIGVDAADWYGDDPDD